MWGKIYFIELCKVVNAGTYLIQSGLQKDILRKYLKQPFPVMETNLRNCAKLGIFENLLSLSFWKILRAFNFTFPEIREI